MGRHEQALMMETGSHPDKMQAGDLLCAANNSDQESASGELAKQSLAAHHKDAANNNHNRCWLAGTRLCLLMSLVLVLALGATLVALFTFRVLEPDAHGCFGGWSSHRWPLNLHPSEYRLFATKTTYSAALSQLHNKQNSPLISQPFDAAYPTTEQLHLELQAQGCQVKQLHFFGRHAARYPSQHEWADMERNLIEVQSLIDLSKFSPPPIDGQQLNETTSANSSCVPIAVSFKPLSQYKQWRGFFDRPQLANQLMLSGALETQALARRYQTLYPNLLGGSLAGPASRGPAQLGVTSQPRTAQTALNFLAALGPLNASSIASLKLDHCEPSLLEQVAKQQVNLERVYESKCFNKFSQANLMERLEFHKQCATFHRENHTINHNLNLTTEPWLTPIAASVASKLRLNDDLEDYSDAEQQANKQPHTLTHDHLKAIYKICKYDTASIGLSQPNQESIWCNLFTQEQLQFLEYIEDVEDYFLQAYGHQSQAKSACVLTQELIRSLKLFKRNQKPELGLYFTHSQVIQRLIAAAVDLDSDEAYRTSVMQEQLQAGKAPQMARRWRTSLMSPFSANLAFTVYQCRPANSHPQTPQDSSRTSSPQDPDDTYLDLDVSSPYKLVVSLNERPILVDGCSHVACDLEQFINHARFDIQETSKCKLDEICLKRVVVN